MNHLEIKAQLRKQVFIRKDICLYLLKKKSQRGYINRKELEKIAPNVFVYEILDIYNEEGPFAYSEMIKDQIEEMLSIVTSSIFGWNEILIKSLLAIGGVTEITKMDHDFSNRPTGFYLIKGIFQKSIPFRIFDVVETE